MQTTLRCDDHTLNVISSEPLFGDDSVRTLLRCACGRQYVGTLLADGLAVELKSV